MSAPVSEADPRQGPVFATSPPTFGHDEERPACVLVIGMAGSGKSTLVKALNHHMLSTRRRPYLVNLDPAVNQTTFKASVDIRDVVDYHALMEKYKWGPNGAIMTCLNLLLTKYDQLETVLEARAEEVDTMIFDTPGQIEVFTWSASGELLTKQLAAVFPTTLLFVVDGIRCADPVTFVSNVLYALSILYRLQ
ncbi:GPN-loop GTPase 1, partial [Kipferlia bialata]|eukprot:g13060.t1